jgi:PAS domain S-box-containing protein
MKPASITHPREAFVAPLHRPHSILLKGREKVRKAARELSATLQVLRRAEEELAVKDERLAAVRQTLEMERERYRGLFEACPDAQVVTNLQGAILEANRTAVSLLHLPPERLSRQLLTCFVAGDDRRRLRLFLFEARARSQTPLRAEMQVRPPGKPGFPAAVAAHPFGPKTAAGVRWFLRDLTEQKRTEAALRDREAAVCCSQVEVRALSERLLHAQDLERQRIARDLHDDITQRLALLAIDIEMLEMDRPQAPQDLREAHRALHRRVVEISNEIRAVTHRLHAGALQDIGLPLAVRRYVRDFSQRTGLRCTVKVADLPQAMPLEMSSSLHRILLECLGNVLKHARASHVTVELACRDAAVHLTVADDGRGFVAEAPSGEAEGLGFVSLRERARMLNGECSVQSHPGQGTIVNVKVPL